jgi:hypothetical protein
MHAVRPRLLERIALRSHAALDRRVDPRRLGRIATSPESVASDRSTGGLREPVPTLSGDEFWHLDAAELADVESQTFGDTFSVGRIGFVEVRHLQYAQDARPNWVT